MANLNVSGSERELANEIEDFVEDHRRAYRVNYFLSVAVIVVGLLLSAGVTISGILDLGKVSAVLGVFIAVMIGLQGSLAIGEKADFNRMMIAEGRILVSRLKFEVDNEREFRSVRRRFEILRRHAAASLPKGQGMETIKKMYEEMTARDA